MRRLGGVHCVEELFGGMRRSRTEARWRWTLTNWLERAPSSFAILATAQPVIMSSPQIAAEQGAGANDALRCLRDFLGVFMRVMAQLLRSACRSAVLTMCARIARIPIAVGTSRPIGSRARGRGSTRRRHAEQVAGANGRICSGCCSWCFPFVIVFAPVAQLCVRALGVGPPSAHGFRV